MLTDKTLQTNQSLDLHMSPSSYGRTLQTYVQTEYSPPKTINFCHKFYGVGGSFIENLDIYHDKFDQFTERLRKILDGNTTKPDPVLIEDYGGLLSTDRYPYLNTDNIKEYEQNFLSDTYEECRDAQNQTDYLFKDYCENRNEYIKNEKTIQFLQREVDLYNKIRLGNETDRMLSKNIKFLLYITNKFSDPKSKNDKKEVSYLKFSNTKGIVELTPLFNSYLPSLYYKFDGVVNSSDKEQSNLLVSDLLNSVDTYRDNLIFIYGGKKSGKREFFNKLIASLLKYYQKFLVDNIVEHIDLKLSTMEKKNHDLKRSEVYLRSKTSEHQIMKLMHSLIDYKGHNFNNNEDENDINTNSERIETPNNKTPHSKCVFIEFSRLFDDKHNKSEFLKSSSSRVSGVYFIICNKPGKKTIFALLINL